MKHKWSRLFSALLCLALFFTGIPAGADDAPLVDSVETSIEAPIAEISPLQDAEPESELPPVTSEEPADAPEQELPAASEELPDPLPTDSIEAAEGAQTPSDETSIPAVDTSLEELVARWISALDVQGMSGDYARALWLYDALITNLSHGDSDDAAAALSGLDASSLGYARAYEALLRGAGVECMTVTGDGSAWNVAKLDGAWTHIDAYADDAPDGFGLHFGLTDAAMARDHRWTQEIPACASAENNYFIRERGYHAFASREDLCALLTAAVERGEAELLLFNAGEEPSVEATARELLMEIDPSVSLAVSENGCLAAMELRYAADAIMTLDAAAPVAQIAVESIVPAADNLTLGVGEHASVATWTMLPAGAQDAVTYTSKSTKIATVNASGEVVAKKAGSTEITLKAADSGASCVVKVTVKKAPSSVTLVADRTVLGVGESLQLGYKLSSGSAGKVTFSITEGQSFAEITPDGLLTARNPGTISVSASTFNNKKPKKAISIEVKKAPASVTLATNAIAIGVGDTWLPGWTLDEGAAGKVSFASANPSVAAVDLDSGMVTAAATGETEITVSAYNGISAKLRVRVVPRPAGLRLEAERTTIGVKEKLALTPVFEGFEGDYCAVSYKSSKSSVASVDAYGVVTAKKTGSATITASTYDPDVKATIQITVKKAPSSVTLVADRTVLGVGESLQLGYKLSSGSAGKVTFSITEGQSFAEITPDGFLTARNPGTISVSASTFNGKKPKKAISIEVKKAPASVTLATNAIAIGMGDTWLPGWTLDEGAAGKVSFASANPSVAAVDPDSGTVTAAAVGETEITVSAYNGISAKLRVRVVPRPAGLRLEAERTTIGVKEKLALTPVFEGFEGDYCAVSYKSSKSSVASVDAYGVVTAKKTGSATITASTYDPGVKATIQITVKKAPSSVTLVADRTVLGVGESLQLGYKLSSGSAGKVTFSITEGQSFAEITPDGFLTARNPGTISVSASTFNGKKPKKAISIEVKNAPSSIALSAASILLGEGQTTALNAAVNEGSAGEISFRFAEDNGVAAVDADGVVTALKPGRARLIAYTYVPGVEAYADVEVRPAPASLRLTATSINLGVGDSFRIEPMIDLGSMAGFSFSSSSKKIATVDANGVVTAVKTGKATVTVKTHNGLSAKLTVNVKKKPSSIKVSPTEMTLGIGESAKVSATLTKDSATTLRYQSSDTSVATVASDGTVTARGIGAAKITVSTHNNLSAICVVTVASAPTSVRLDVPDVLGVKQRVKLAAEVTPADSHTTLNYSLVSGDAVQIDGNELVAVKVGTAVLRASTHVSGVYAERTITVKAAPGSISFDQSEYIVNIGETLRLLPTLPNDTAAGLTYKIEKSGFFTIDEDGLVTPVALGKSKVTATTHNGKSASTSVWVVDPYYPETIDFAQTPPTALNVGDSFTPKLTVFPATAIPEMRWSTSDADIASVDAASGMVTARSYGRATITGTSGRNAKLSLSYEIIVLSPGRCLIMPDHRTDTSAISNTLQQIRNVRSSAYQELDELLAKGWISSSEKNKRQGYVERAFDMYLFPWMTETLQLYWKEANSEGGEKNFKPGIVYYGLPYTQTNRVNSRESVISDGYYKDSGKGYYLLQDSKFTSRRYPGSDCSSFVSIAIWGMSNSRRGDSTSIIAKANYYKTLDSDYWQDLRPGDLLCLGGHHVAMFLYYTNEARTQFVIIEQGGGGNDLYSNCVSTCIRDQSYYISRGYKIRRVSDLDMDYMK